MLVPYLKRIVDAAHDLGIYFELHSCGKNEMLVPAMIEAGVDMWNGQPMNDKKMLVERYGDKMIFTHEVNLEPDAADEEVDAAVAKFMEEFGYDNLGYNGTRDERFRKKLYEASRKNYDRLVAEGKAIL